MTPLPVRAAAMRLGIASSTLKQWIYAGRVRTILTAGGHHRVPDEEVERLRSNLASPGPRRRSAAGRPALVGVSDANRVRGLVEEVRSDGLIAQVRLGVGNHLLTAVISAEALADLRLRRGEHAVALFSSTDVMIAKEWDANGGTPKRQRRRR